MEKEKLEKGREALEKGRKKAAGRLQEFKEFILRGNVMDMAVGVIIGSAFGTIITAVTDDFINPLINGIGGVEVAGKINIYGGQALNWGHFVTAIINFLITAFVLFEILKIFNRISSIGKKKKEEEVVTPIKSDETILLEEIRDLLKSKK